MMANQHGDHARDDAAITDDLTFLAGIGVGATEAAHRVGFSGTRHLDKWLRRHDQLSLLHRLTAQDYRPVTTGRNQWTA